MVNSVDYKRWEKVTLVSQLLIAGFVFVTEIINNALLYVTRTQGYGPETIVEKLLRYLVLTTVINFGLILISQIILKFSNKNDEESNYIFRRMILMLATVLICTDVAYSHYQFADTLVIFIVPIMICILYEDVFFSKITFFLCTAGMTVAIVARASDDGYNKDIGPEAAIALSFLISEYIFARLIMKTLHARRLELAKAMANAERMNAAEERVQLSLKTFETLARALDAKDKYTNGHAERVSIYSTILAKKLGYSEEEIEKLKYEALLHDIGKIGVPDSILNKPDKLTDVEFSIIKSHTVVGGDILKDMLVAPGARDVALHHHERFDGRGYPEGLSGENISRNARIVCIADTYDAMSSDRIYRKALSREIIREELIKGRGTQFDPQMLDVFLELFDNYKLRADKEGQVKTNNYDHIQEYLRDDIDSALYRISNEEKPNSNQDIDKYLRNIGLRYKQDIVILCFSLKKQDISVDESQFADKVDKVMERAIKKCIRTTDIYYKYSDMVHYVIFVNVDETVVDVIAKRILFEYNESDYKDIYEVNYELGKSSRDE